MSAPRLLDIFCGRGGWASPFIDRGWSVLGVDLADFSAIYPGEFVQGDARSICTIRFVNAFDAVVMSPPCEEFARAHLPWQRGDGQPARSAVELLHWAVRLTRMGRRRVVECSNFAAKHCEGAVRVGSWSFWGDVPVLMPEVRGQKYLIKGSRSDRPARRAVVPYEFGAHLAHCWSR